MEYWRRIKENISIYKEVNSRKYFTFKNYHNQPHPSESLQQAPTLTSATRGADTRSMRGYNSLIYKNVTTLKTYKNEKTENYNSDKGERKKTQKNS